MREKIMTHTIECQRDGVTGCSCPQEVSLQNVTIQKMTCLECGGSGYGFTARIENPPICHRCFGMRYVKVII